MNATPSNTRARSKEMKDAKREELIRAAERLFDTLEITEITLQVLAEEAGFSTSNIYRYFEQQDDVFMEVLNVKFARYVNDVEVLLRYVKPDVGHDQKLAQVVEIFATAIGQHRVYGKLLSLYGARLEENSSIEAVVRHKTILIELGGKMMEQMARIFSAADATVLFGAMLNYHSFLAGFWACAYPGKTSQKVHEMEQFQGHLPDGDQTIKHMLRLLLTDAVKGNVT